MQRLVENLWELNVEVNYESICSVSSCKTAIKSTIFIIFMVEDKS